MNNIIDQIEKAYAQNDIPRLQIGDTIRAFEPPYFRCIGRDRWFTPIVYAWEEFQSFNLGRL